MLNQLEPIVESCNGTMTRSSRLPPEITATQDGGATSATVERSNSEYPNSTNSEYSSSSCTGSEHQLEAPAVQTQVLTQTGPRAPAASVGSNSCTKDKQLLRQGSMSTGLRGAHYLGWLRLYLMVMVPFNHTIWLVAVRASNSPAYGGVHTPPTGPVSYLIARFLLGANLGHSMGLFFLSAGYVGMVGIQSMGLWSFVLSKVRYLTIPCIIWELLLFPMVLYIGNGDSTATTYRRYFEDYTGIGQLGMWRMVLVQICVFSLALLYGGWMTAQRFCSCFLCQRKDAVSADQLLPTRGGHSSASPLHASRSQRDMVIFIAAGAPAHNCSMKRPANDTSAQQSAEDIGVVPAWGCTCMCMCGSDPTTLVDEQRLNSIHEPINEAGHVTAEPGLSVDHLAKPPSDATPFTVRFTTLAAGMVIFVQTLVMWAVIIRTGLTWNLQGIIVQYCFLGQYVIAYCLGIMMKQYNAFERLPVRFGYWCLPVSILIYSACYAGSMLRPEPAYPRGYLHEALHGDSVLAPQARSSWHERLPTVSLQLSHQYLPNGLLLSSSSPPWLLLDSFVTQAWAVLFNIGLLVVFKVHCNKKPGRYAQLVIDAASAFYIILPLVLVSIARVFHVLNFGLNWHPFQYIGIVWPLLFFGSHAIAMTIRSLPGADLFL